MSINYKGDIKNVSIYKLVNAFLIERGDSLDCEIYKDSIIFYGKGSEKMNLQTKLFQISSRNITSVSQPFTDFMLIRDKVFNEQIEYLKSQKSQVTLKIFNYLYYQCLGNKNDLILSYIKANLNFKNDIKWGASMFKNVISHDQIVNEEAHLSSFYMDYLYKKIKFQFQLDNPERTSLNRIGSKSIIEAITKNYTGKIRDKLFLIAFSDLPRTSLDVFSRINEAIKITRYLPYKEALQEIASNCDDKQKAFEFTLPDSSNNPVSLKNYRGYTIIMDFWFTGCIPCLQLAKKMIPIIEHFETKKVIFITINVDSSIEKWKRSLKSHTYTHNKSINLFANAIGKTAPITTHYNINSFPRLILIDKNGQIISASPPRPFDQERSESFIKLIEDNL